ncbi:MAG TPA: ATP-binding protein [Novosphingobium sp.]
MMFPDGYDEGEVEAATVAAKLENGIIPHPALKNAQKALRLHQLRSLPLDGRAPQAGHLLLVTGEPGAGKSTLLALHKERFKDVRDEDGLRITAVLAEMPTPCTKKGVVEAIFRSMHHDVPKDWNAAHIIEEIARLVREHHVLMIMLDEADRIFGVDTEGVAKFLVSLLNTVKAQFVLAGAPTLLKLNSTYGLERRTEEDIVLAPYRWDTGDGQKNFRTLLQVFDHRLGLGKLAGLHEFDLARRIYVATGGHVGIVSKLLVAAARRAAEGGRTLDRKLLGDTWADLRRKDQEPEDIDFDRDVMKDPVKPKPPVLREDNPLLCRADRVKAIWAAQRAAAAEAEAAKEVAKRGRRTIPGRRRSART